MVTGIIRLKINGTLRRSKADAKLMTGGVNRTPQVGHSLFGFSEEVQPAEIEATLSHMSDTDLLALNALRDATVEFITDTGVTFLITGATLTEPTTLTGGDGDVDLKMSGNPAVES